MVAAARTLLKQISILDDYGRGTTASQGERFKQTIFNGLNQFHLGSDPTSNSSAKVEIETPRLISSGFRGKLRWSFGLS